MDIEPIIKYLHFQGQPTCFIEIVRHYINTHSRMEVPRINSHGRSHVQVMEQFSLYLHTYWSCFLVININFKLF